MKRFIRIFICFVLVFTVLTPITCFAAEVAEDPKGISYHTIFTRLMEFVEENKTEVVSAAGSGLLLAVSGILNRKNAKKSKELNSALGTLTGIATGTSNAQNSIINAVNEMISGNNVMTDGYNKMRDAYERYENAEDDRNRLIGAVMVQNAAILEMLATVYVHNRNVPQGVKDLVTLRYANVEKILSNDDLLRSIVESVRDKINAQNAEEDEEQTENVETAEE